LLLVDEQPIDRAAARLELTQAGAGADVVLRDFAAAWLPQFLDVLSGKEGRSILPAWANGIEDAATAALLHMDELWLERWVAHSNAAGLEQREDALRDAVHALEPFSDALQMVSTARVRGFLREVDRIVVGEPAAQRPSYPYQLARTVGGDIFVTGSGRLFHLDRKGKPIEEMEQLTAAGRLKTPTGVAVDGTDRVWVADYEAARLAAYDGRTRSFAAIHFAGDTSPLKHPHGLCYRSDGVILVADTLNRRIVAVESGEARALVRASGMEWFPLGVFVDAADTTGAFWVVDQRNHLLEEFDRDGRLIREIGGCGLGKGRLVLPESAVVLADRSLLVSQYRFNRMLKLLALDGTEIARQRLDDPPAGLLEHDGYVLVANVGGSEIRVYERR
jgi:hypothetical protein